MPAEFLQNFQRRAVLLLAALCLLSRVLQAGWSVEDAAPGRSGCMLQTEQISLFDGYSDTLLRLSVADGAVRVRTDSNIDPGFGDLGIVVDGKAFFPADAVAGEKDVLFSSAAAELVEQFIRGRAVTVYLRFWPTYPATQRYEARFSLIGFTRAYREYQACSDGPPA